MSGFVGPKSRKSRRVGMRLHPKDDKIFTKRNFPPGMHAQRRRRVSEYGTQLLEKQKAKWLYGVMEKQFRKYYEKAIRKTGDSGIILMQLLETRLDNAVFRLGLAQTRPQARQFVSHGFFEVNGKKVNVPSYPLKVGDQISIKISKKDSKIFQNLKNTLVKHQAPLWLELKASEMAGRVLSLPGQGQLEPNIKPSLIIEHYSR